MDQDDERTPVIVGVGQYNDRPEDPDEGVDSLGLMERALRLADEDAGGGWLADLDSLTTVDQISWLEINNLLLALANRVGANPKHLETSYQASGDSPIKLLHQAANRIGSGEMRIAAVAGGEALRSAAHFARKAAAGQPTQSSHAKLSRARASDYRRRYGLISAVDLYPLYENAGRAAYGQSLAEAQRESAAIWARFSEVAHANPGAWIRKAVSAEEIATPSADNRPIAHPYTKLMVANSAVNQGAAFIVTSVAEARRRGVDTDRLIYVGYGAAAHENEDPLCRDRYDASSSMRISLEKTLELNGITSSDLDFVELYSCFPCVPKMARRILNWPVERPASVFGGLTFGGGPIGNYMSHAVVSMVEKLRLGGQRGLLFANGGTATHNHSIILSNKPQAGLCFPQNYDFQALADAARGDTPTLQESYEGPATLETYTVLYDRTGAPRFGVILARLPNGNRTLAKIPTDDQQGIAFLTDGRSEPVDTSGVISKDQAGDQLWRCIAT